MCKSVPWFAIKLRKITASGSALRKKNGVKSTTAQFSDRSSALDEEIVKQFMKHAEWHGLTLSLKYMQVLILSRKPPATTAFAWMHNFFE